MCCGGSNAAILGPMLDNPEADRALAAEAIARAVGKGWSIEEAELAYGMPPVVGIGG